LAKDLLSKNYLPASILGAKLYEKIGQGKKAIPGLIEATDKASRNEGFDERDYREISSFLKKHTGGKYVLGTGYDEDGNKKTVLVDKGSGLEAKFIPVIVIVFLVASLFFYLFL